MRNHIEYIAKTLNFELGELEIEKMGTVLAKTNIEDFKAFIELNLNHTDLAFKNGWQKFIMLSRMYENLIRDEAEKKSENYSKVLYEKIKAVFIKYQDMNANDRPTLSDMRFGKFFDGDKPLFGDKDIEVIAKVWKFFGGENGFESLYKVWVLDNTQLIKAINESVTEKVELALQGRVQNLIESKRG